MGCDSSFVYVFSEFSDLCDFAFPALLRTFLSKEPSETVDSLTTVDFLVSVRILRFFFYRWFALAILWLGASY